MGGLLLGIFAVLVLATVPIGFALAPVASIAVVVADLPAQAAKAERLVAALCSHDDDSDRAVFAPCDVT